MSSIAPGSQRSPAMLRLVLILGGMLALYIVLTGQFWLPALVERSRVTIGTLTNRSFSGASQFVLAGITLHALYVVGALLLWHASEQRALQRLVWLGAILTTLVLLWAYPVTSTDLFDYIFRARMTVNHDANPYLVLPNEFKTDPLYRYIGWPNAPSAYGPLWEAVSRLLAWLGGSALLPTVLLYKALAAAAFLLCGATIQAIARGPQTKLLGSYIWLWNPLAVWEFAAIGHNDGFLILALLLALYAAQHQRFGLAVLALVGGALFKFLPVIFIPLVVLAWLRAVEDGAWLRRGQIVVQTGLLCLLPTALLYTAYWDLPTNFAQLGIADQLTAIWQGRTTTLRNVAVREGFLNASPLAVLSYQLQSSASLAQINAIGRALGWPAAGSGDVRAAVSTFGSLLLASGILWQSWQVWYRRRPLQAAFFGLMLWYVVGSSQWFQPWYVLWVLGLFALQPTRASFGWLTAWALMAQASYLLQYIVLPNLKLSGQTLQAQIYYLLLIYPLPLLVWLLVRYWPLHRSGRSRPSSNQLASER